MFRKLRSWLHFISNRWRNNGNSERLYFLELPDVQAGLEKAKQPEIKLQTSTVSEKKLENSRKTSTSALLTTPKPLTVWITINCGKFLKRWEYQTT